MPPVPFGHNATGSVSITTLIAGRVGFQSYRPGRAWRTSPGCRAGQDGERGSRAGPAVRRHRRHEAFWGDSAKRPACGACPRRDPQLGAGGGSGAMPTPPGLRSLCEQREGGGVGEGRTEQLRWLTGGV